MKTIALEKAREHLRLAREAADKLTPANGFRSYSEAWSQFLAQVSRFYSKMEQGAKGCNKSEPWFGRRKRERKTDQLLSYLHHARDSDEHGLEDVCRIRVKGASLKFPQTQEVRASIMMRMNEDGTMDIRNPSVTTPDGTFDQVELEDPRFVLVTVRDDRFGDKFDPPVMHLGHPIVGREPPILASLALRYLDEFLADAETLPTHT
jgi:hypothetical protein